MSSDDDQTQSTQTRYAYTNDLLAGLLLTTLSGAVVASMYFGWSAPQGLWLPFVTVCLLAAVWTFGTEAVQAVKQLRK